MGARAPSSPQLDILGCCSFGQGRCGTCGEDGSGYCHKSKVQCEEKCSPGLWLPAEHPPRCEVHPTSAPPPVQDSGRGCCSFGNGQCGKCAIDGTGFCHKSNFSCETKCAPGVWL